MKFNSIERRLLRALVKKQVATRNDLATVLGKNRLNPTERRTLTDLVARDIVQEKRRLKGHLVTSIYRINPEFKRD